MRAILLAAGLGSRLRPSTNTTPKCLVDINGHPLLEYWLRGLFASGIEKVLINLHYLPDRVREFVQSSPFRDRIALVHEPVLLGTARTLAHNWEFFEGKPAFVAHADNLCICDFRRFIAAHNSRPRYTEITMMSFETTDPRSCGILEIESGRIVTRFFEKVSDPPGNIANGAVYVFENSVIQFCRQSVPSPQDISKDVIPRYLGRIAVWHNDVYHRDIGSLESLEAARKDIRNFEGTLKEMSWF